MKNINFYVGMRSRCRWKILLFFIFAAEAGIFLNSFLNFEQKWALCSYKIVLEKSVYG